MENDKLKPVAWRWRPKVSWVTRPLPWQFTDQQWLADQEAESGSEVEPLYSQEVGDELASIKRERETPVTERISYYAPDEDSIPIYGSRVKG
ncbi:hypothetical protein [Mesorhizobium sp.]|uniref:hypothetical protein n=1 Tax=Mesorhizobium sp. TaxID=1871066 RepID=UPI000FE42814|nr:hypothetical protein [Mesorhizobium sp.]RWK39218.1 MAG: hypothetical protein EOR40_04190 [Mesorhizobium sp.]